MLAKDFKRKLIKFKIFAQKTKQNAIAFHLSDKSINNWKFWPQITKKKLIHKIKHQKLIF